MRTVFMGTPDFACGALRTLLDSGQEVALVLTQPDKPKGRGYALTPSPVKRLAKENGLRVETPATLRSQEAEGMLREAGADLFVVAAYGKILPAPVLAMPRLGCVNVHASLLPRWRGASPIQRAILHGDTVGGVTMLYMDEGLDTGDVILQKSMEIPPEMTGGEYHDALCALGSEALREFLNLAEAGTVPRRKQTGESCYAAKLEKSDLFVSFRETAKQTHDRIRALSPVPTAFGLLGEKRVKLLASRASDGRGEPGKILSAGKDGVEVACSDGSVLLTAVQPEGKGRMDACSFWNGLRDKAGLRFHD